MKQTNKIVMDLTKGVAIAFAIVVVGTAIAYRLKPRRVVEEIVRLDYDSIKRVEFEKAKKSNVGALITPQISETDMNISKSMPDPYKDKRRRAKGPDFDSPTYGDWDRPDGPMLSSRMQDEINSRIQQMNQADMGPSGSAYKRAAQNSYVNPYGNMR